MPRFKDCVQEAWSKEVLAHLNPFVIFHVKLSRIAKAIKAWSKTLIPHEKLAMAVSREVILQLEKVQEFRQLSPGECSLIRLLKSRILGLATIQKSRARQKFRLTWIRLGDANTKYFHLMANARKKRNYTHSL
jgi:hypothetical protein